MEEGRHIEAGRAAEPSEKVIRLPRDWLGPRDHLVPFGKATPDSADPAAPELSAPELASPTPTSADDFWGGEPSAAPHDVVEADDDRSPAPAPSSPLRRRRVAATSLVGVAAACAIAFMLPGSPHHVADGAKLNIAAILTNGVSRILSAGPPKVVARQPPTRPVRHVRHRAHVTKSAPPHTSHSSNPPRSTHTYVARATPTIPTPTYHPPVSEPTPRVETRPSPARSPASSAARVSPTGQAGALGPVHSPNG